MRALAQRLTINDLYKLDICLRSVAEHKRIVKRVPFLKSSVGHIFYENGRRIANVTTNRSFPVLIFLRSSYFERIN